MPGSIQMGKNVSQINPKLRLVVVRFIHDPPNQVMKMFLGLREFINEPTKAHRVSVT